MNPDKIKIIILRDHPPSILKNNSTLFSATSLDFSRNHTGLKRADVHRIFFVERIMPIKVPRRWGRDLDFV